MAWKLVNPNITNDPSYLEPQITDHETRITNNTTSLAENVSRTKGWINLAEYPIISPETSDSPRIQRALNAMVEGSKLLLSGGTLSINTPIVIKTKNIQLLALEKVTIQATSTMEACLSFQGKDSSSISYGVDIENINFDGNHLANYCIKLEDTVGLYISEIRFLKCKFTNAVLDGVKVGAPAWVIKFNKCNSEFNGRDGFRVNTNGSSQVNAVQIIECVINNNTGNGISMNGISNLIKGNDIEKNYYGISIDPSIDTSGNPNNAFKITIEGNYLELNKQAEIFIQAYRSGQVNGISIKDNYFWSNVVGGTGTLIKCVGSLGYIVNLKIADNVFQVDGVNVTKYIDGSNGLGTDSDVGVIDNTTHFVNIGLAKASWSSYTIFPISPNIIQNSVYVLNQRSSNILSLTPKKIVFGLPAEITSKLVRSMNVYTETDSTNYTIRCTYIVKSLTTGAIVKQSQTDVAMTQSGLVTFNILNSLAYERRTNTEFFYFGFEVLSNTNGTYLYYHVPYLEMSH